MDASRAAARVCRSIISHSWVKISESDRVTPEQYPQLRKALEVALEQIPSSACLQVTAGTLGHVSCIVSRSQNANNRDNALLMMHAAWYISPKRTFNLKRHVHTRQSVTKMFRKNAANRDRTGDRTIIKRATQASVVRAPNCAMSALSRTNLTTVYNHTIMDRSVGSPHPLFLSRADRTSQLLKTVYISVRSYLLIIGRDPQRSLFTSSPSLCWPFSMLTGPARCARTRQSAV